MSLDPEHRTQLLFYDNSPGSTIFYHVLNDVYNGKWTILLGDFELAFVVFISLGCFRSFEFWYVP